MEFDWIPRVIGRLSNILKRSDVSRMCILYTHQSFNIEPENDAFQKKTPFPRGYIFRFHVKLQGCIYPKPTSGFFIAQWLHPKPSPQKTSAQYVWLLNFMGVLYLTFWQQKYSTSVGDVLENFGARDVVLQDAMVPWKGSSSKSIFLPFF